MVDVEQAKQLRIDGSIDQAATQESASKAKIRDAIAKLNEALEVIELPRAMTVGAEEEHMLTSRNLHGVRFVGGTLHRPRAHSRGYRNRGKAAQPHVLDQLRAGGVDLYATLPSGSTALVRREKDLGDQYYTLLAKIRENPEKQLVAQLQAAKEQWVAAHDRLLSASPAYRKLLIQPLTKRSAVRVFPACLTRGNG